MRLLFDTHAALWALESADMLSPTAREAVRDADELYLSVVSPWELVIKAALGKAVLTRSIDDICRELNQEFGAKTLPVRLPHVFEVARLAPHHGDPFDRLLIAQARVEALTIVTRDHLFAPYGIPLVKA